MNGKGKYIAILGVILTLITLGGTIIGVNNHFAKASEVKELSNSFHYHTTKERLHAVQERIWMLEDRYGGIGVPTAPQSVIEEYRNLKAEEQALLIQLGS